LGELGHIKIRPVKGGVTLREVHKVPFEGLPRKPTGAQRLSRESLTGSNGAKQDKTTKEITGKNMGGGIQAQ